MKLNKYIIFAIIYFFLNSLGLPIGLTYTALLCPFFYWWVLVSRKQEILLPFFLCLLPFITLQVLTGRGLDIKSYLLSLFNLTAVYIFCQTFYTFLKNCKDIERIFRKLLILNFILCLIAIPLYFTSYYDILWIEQFLTHGIDAFRRLKLFTYEASYYATLFVPLLFFYFLKLVTGRNRSNIWILLIMLLLPLALSFSLGVLSAILMAVLIAFLIHGSTIVRKRRGLKLIAWVLLASVTGLAVMAIFFPGNALFLRLTNILGGNDQSGRGRTTDSFVLANKILDRGNYWWGIGPGQIKIVGAEIIRGYYGYPPLYMVITIPNAVAETWAVFGFIGLLLRFTIEISLFFYTRVWSNYYRLLLFIFIFIYQFSGSFITNLAEYVIWILAFTNVFPVFDITSAKTTPTANYKNAPIK
jgi:hypothetical protein